MASNPDEQHAILLAHVAFIERDGLFPERARFMVEQQARVAAFDALEKDRTLLRWQERTVWTVTGLKVVAKSAPFAAQALERGRALFDEMKSMFSVELDMTHGLEELRKRLGWEVNDVRRTMMLMYSFPIFHGFSILMAGHEEEFGMTDGVLRLDAAVFDWAGADQPDEALPCHLHERHARGCETPPSDPLGFDENGDAICSATHSRPVDGSTGGMDGLDSHAEQPLRFGLEDVGGGLFHFGAGLQDFEVGDERVLGDARVDDRAL